MTTTDTTGQSPRDLGALLSVEGRLGSGGMADVYAATLNDSGRSVAVKRIKPTLGARTDARGRFANEVDILERCRGAHVLELIHHGSWEGIPSYVCERCTSSLTDIATARPLGAAQILRITSEILIALDRVHELGIVHRDIKPSNILIGEDGLVRLADFGIAMHPFNRLTQQGSRIGTETYTSPDLAPDPRRATPGHDLFALGLLIFALRTHRQPELLTDPERRDAVLSTVCAPLAALIERATHPNPLERYQSAGAMAVGVLRALSYT